jgi:hypothetical protein
MTTPYEGATSGTKAREEIIKVLRRFGCEEIGFSDNDRHEVLLYFRHRGRQAQLRVSAKGWAQMWLKANPPTYRTRTPQQLRVQEALRQGRVAVNSMLRDWIKGQVTAVECGLLSFEAVFLPFMLTADGRPVLDHVIGLLPNPEAPKVVALPPAP